MYIQDFTGEPQAVIDKAFEDAKLHPKKTPGIEQATRVVGDVLKKDALAKITEEVRIDLADQVAMYEVNNGEYSDTPEGDEHARTRDDYESGMDDAIERAVEKYEEHLSADWLGKNTIDTAPWEEGRVDALAQSAAKEIWKQLTYEKTPNQILSNAGITLADVETRLASHIQNQERPMSTTNDINSVAAKIKAHVGDGYDQMAVYEDIEILCEEDDEILSGAAASRLGLGGEDVNTIQMAVLEMDDAPTEIEAKVQSASAKAEKEDKPKGRPKKQPEEPVEGAVDVSVLQLLKEYGGVGDTAMAEKLGVSRSTYTNWVKGKSQFAPDADQYQIVREQVVTAANALLEALSKLDGTEQQSVA